MCCFSFARSKLAAGHNPLTSVSNTNIFARGSRAGRQYLVYSMTLKAEDELAMILPIPVPEKTDEHAVKFIDLKEYADFFVDLKKGFPTRTVPRVHSRSIRSGGGSADPLPKLEVVEVGSFQASFVPSIADFERLDERFRLPKEVWDDLPQYKMYGFAVFRLKPGEKRIHPMAFEFPRANPKQLFFPTVHIHDGKVHDTAHFDHALYCQENEGENLAALLQWRESPQLAEKFMRAEASGGVINANAHCYLRRMTGTLKNADTLV